MNVRRAIRKSIVEAVTGRTMAGQRVFEMRTIPFGEDELPAINIIPVAINSELITHTFRKLAFAICGVVSSKDNCNDLVDDIEQEILNAMKCVIPNCKIKRYLNTDFAFDSTGLSNMVSVRVIFEFEYIPEDFINGF